MTETGQRNGVAETFENLPCASEKPEGSSFLGRSSLIPAIQIHDDVSVPSTNQNSNGPARIGTEEEDEEKDTGDILTDETSTLKINSYVFMAVISLLRSLRQDENLFFRSHGFPVKS